MCNSLVRIVVLNPPLFDAIQASELEFECWFVRIWEEWSEWLSGAEV